MKKQFKILFASFLIVICTLLLWNEAGRGRQYQLGMTIGEASSLMSGLYQTKMFGVEYDQTPTSKQMNEDALYYIYDENEGIMLMFNHHEKLIRKTRIKILGVNCFKLMDSIRHVTKRLGFGV